MRRGVTLIEAIVALVILSAAFVAALEARARLLVSTRAVVESQRVLRLQESLFREVVAGTVPDGVIADGMLVIEGEHLGEAYRVTVRPERVANPALGAVGYAVREEVGILRYDVTIAGESSTFYWYRR
ncbi:MAG: hypothetical protein Tsb0013_04360 [Phycisphaerales bacterium]